MTPFIFYRRPRPLYPFQSFFFFLPTFAKPNSLDTRQSQVPSQAPCVFMISGEVLLVFCIEVPVPADPYTPVFPLLVILHKYVPPCLTSVYLKWSKTLPLHPRSPHYGVGIGRILPPPPLVYGFPLGRQGQYYSRFSSSLPQILNQVRQFPAATFLFVRNF